MEVTAGAGQVCGGMHRGLVYWVSKGGQKQALFCRVCHLAGLVWVPFGDLVGNKQQKLSVGKSG